MNVSNVAEVKRVPVRFFRHQIKFGQLFKVLEVIESEDEVEEDKLRLLCENFNDFWLNVMPLGSAALGTLDLLKRNKKRTDNRTVNYYSLTQRGKKILQLPENERIKEIWRTATKYNPVLRAIFYALGKETYELKARMEDNKILPLHLTEMEKFNKKNKDTMKDIRDLIKRGNYNIAKEKLLSLMEKAPHLVKFPSLVKNDEEYILSLYTMDKINVSHDLIGKDLQNFLNEKKIRPYAYFNPFSNVEYERICKLLNQLLNHGFLTRRAIGNETVSSLDIQVGTFQLNIEKFDEILEGAEYLKDELVGPVEDKILQTFIKIYDDLADEEKKVRTDKWSIKVYEKTGLIGKELEKYLMRFKRKGLIEVEYIHDPIESIRNKWMRIFVKE